MFRRRLKWVAKELGILEARDDSYEYVVFADKDSAELRIIRRENVGGLIAPMQDFSVFTRDADSATDLAEKINKLLRKSREYNKFQTLF